MGKVSAKPTDQAKKVSQRTSMATKGVEAFQKKTNEEVQKEVSDNIINGEVSSEPNKIEPVIHNSVPCSKPTSDVFSERKDKEVSSKTLIQLNPLGE